MRIVDERASQRRALRHPARQLMRKRVRECGQADQVERGIDASSGIALRATRLGAEPDVVAYGPPREQRRVLEHDHARGVRSADALAVGVDRTLRRRFQAGHETQQRRFAAAARS
ncbi:hypothetical protein OKW41_003920 [Paraburkholderia sp. UCT70]